MRKKKPFPAPEQADPVKPSLAMEGLIEKNMEDLVTFLSPSGNGKSMLHDDIMTMVERNLFKIALRRADNVRSKAAIFLGVNRNTFQKKLIKLGLDGDH